MKLTLTNENISMACREAEDFLAGRKADSKDRIRVMLTLEEVLLTYQKAFGMDAMFILDMGSDFGRGKLRITVPGTTLDPFTRPDSSVEDGFMRDAMTRMGQLPRWRYRRGRNEIQFTLEKKQAPDWAKLLAAILLAAACGLLVRVFPENVRSVLQDGIMTPLISTFLGFLNAVAGPMVFLSVVWGIYSIGDTATFSVMGKKLGLRYALYLCASGLLALLVCLPFFRLNFGSAQGGGGELTALFQMVLDIIPANLFRPFSTNNTLQILFVAIIIGVAMLLVNKETNSVASLSEQLGFIVNGIMSAISRLIPAFVFGSLFCIVASSDISVIAAGGKFFLVTLLGAAAVMVLHLAATCVKYRMTPWICGNGPSPPSSSPSLPPPPRRPSPTTSAPAWKSWGSAGGWPISACPSARPSTSPGWWCSFSRRPSAWRQTGRWRCPYPGW